MKSGTPQVPPSPPRRMTATRPVLLLILLPLLALAVSLEAGRSNAAPSLDSEEQTFLTLINNYRQQHGLNPLVTDDRLNAAADWFANDMANDNYFASNHHDNENPPRSPGQRAAAFGFNAPVGENLAAGYITAQSVFDAWKGSAGHNNNMLGNYIGIGIARAYSPSSTFGWYWVTDFAVYIPAPANTPPPPTQMPTQTPPAATTPPATQPPNTPPPTAPPLPPTNAPPPAPAGDNIWGDTNCDGQISPTDTLRVLRLDAGLETSVLPGCPPMGGEYFVGGSMRLWGDFNCSSDVNPIDAILLLRFDAGLSVNLPPGCPHLGSLV